MLRMEKARAEEIENIVDTVFNKYNIKTADTSGELTVDVSRLATLLGFTVAGTSLNRNADGFIISTSKYKFIAINHDRTVAEKRFLIAYALGCYYLHNGDINLEFRICDCTPHSYDVFEQCYFAACLLMSADIFKKMYSKIVEKYAQITQQSNDMQTDALCVCRVLAKIFNVPYEFALRRMYALELVGTN